MTVTCPCGCGETFSQVGSRGRERRFFSPACSLRVHRVSGGGDGRRHTTETIAVLSEKASRPKPWLRGERNGMFGRTGPANPNYKDGSSGERQRLYASSEWRALLRSIRKRDGLRCTSCGRAGGELQVHNILPWAEFPDLRFEPSNLITLCRQCHIDEHRKGGGANQ